VLPNPDNRITLSSEKDAMGIPKPEAHYSIGAYTRRGAQAARKDFAKIAEMLGGTGLRYTPKGQFANNQHSQRMTVHDVMRACSKTLYKCR
jgi:hypothetical protein